LEIEGDGPKNLLQNVGRASDRLAWQGKGSPGSGVHFRTCHKH